MKLRFLLIALLAAILTACGGTPAATTPAPTPTTQVETAPSVSVPATAAPAAPAVTTAPAATAPATTDATAAPTMDHSAMPMESATPASAPKTPAEVVLTLDYMRGHLLVSSELVKAGDFDAAYIHASHPAGEHYFTIHSAVEAVDPSLDQQATAALKAHADAVQAKDAAAIGPAREAVQKVFDQIEAKVDPNSAQETAMLVATLLNTAAAEYGEAIQGSKVVETVEYQDAYGFTRQAAVRLNAHRDKVDMTQAATLDVVLTLFTTATETATPPTAVTTMPEALQAAATPLSAIGLIGGGDSAALKLGLDALITGPLAQVRAASTAGNREQVGQAFAAFEDGWAIIEDGVRAQSPEAYRAIEAAMEEVENATVRADVLDDATVQVNADALRKAIEDFTATLQ